MSTRSGFLLVLIIVAAHLLFGCGAGDDDDDSTDTSSDDSGADDAAGDDAGDDSSDNADDDSASDDSSDDAGDDTADDDALDTALLVIGYTGRGYSSFLQTGTGWTEQPIPNPDDYDNFPITITPVFGPSFFRDGAKGYAAWNYVLAGDFMPPVYLEGSASHLWLSYEPDTGWKYEFRRIGGGVLANIDAIFIDGQDSMHAIGDFWYSETGHANTFQIDSLMHRFVAHTGAIEYTAASHSYITAFAFADDGTGMAGACDSNGAGTWLTYDGSVWFTSTMPYGYEEGSFIWFLVFDSNHAVAVWEKTLTSYESKMMSYDSGAWSEITAPSGCESLIPTKIYGDQNLFVAIDEWGTDDRFWQYKDGTWSCRTLEGAPADATIMQALVFKNGRTFLALKGTYDQDFLFEVTQDGSTEIAMPAGFSEFKGLHAVGPQAPASNPAVPMPYWRPYY